MIVMLPQSSEMTANWNSKFTRATVILLAVSVVLRVGWAILIPVIPVSDSFAYDALAKTLATQGVYGWTPDQPTAFWPVGTSALYAVLYTLFGHNFIPIVGLNIVLGTCIVLETIWLARLFFDEDIGLLAGGVVAIWPSEVAYSTILASELPFIFFVLLGFCAWFNSRLSFPSRGIASGLAFAAAGYVRPIALMLPVILWLAGLTDFRKLRDQLSMMLVAMIVIAACVAPWAVRNTKLFGHFMLISSNGGVTFWMGNNPESDGTYMAPPPPIDKLNAYERDRQLSQAAWRYTIDHPLAFVARTAKKAILLHLNETIAVHWNAKGIEKRLGSKAILPLKLLMQAYWSFVLLLAVVGVTILARNLGPMRALMHPIVATWIYFTAVYSIMLVQDRYHFPSHPFIAMLAAISLATILRRPKHGAVRVGT